MITEEVERKLVKKYGLAACPTMGAAGIHTRRHLAVDASGGRRRLAAQCPDCGQVLDASGTLASHPHAPAVDAAAAERRAAQIAAATAQRNGEIRQRHAIQRSRAPSDTADWFAWYSGDYLRSPGWHDLRALVLDRDRHLCQCCLGCRATEVHHRSYGVMRVGDLTAHQPAFDLVAVCHQCHEAITAAERAGRVRVTPPRAD